MTFKMLAVAAALAFALPATANAQHKHNHGHGHSETGKNGGQMVSSGDYHIELVAKGGAVTIHVMDHDDKPVSVSGFKGLAILSVGGKSQRIVLEPGESGRMTGNATGELPARPKGVVQITPAGGKTVSAKF